MTQNVEPMTADHCCSCFGNSSLQFADMTDISAWHPVSLTPKKQINVSIGSGYPQDWSGDLLALGVFEGDLPSKEGSLSGCLATLDASLDGAIEDIIQTYEFKGKEGSQQAVRVGGKIKNVVLIGLGKVEDAALEAKWGLSLFQTLGAAAAAAAKTTKARTLALALTQLPPVDEGEASGKAANGLLHAIYETSRFKSSETGPKLESAELLFGGKDGAAAVQRAQAFVAGATLTRYLVEAPPNVCTPAHLAQAAEEIAESAPDVYQLKVLEKADCEALKMGLYLGVAEASALPPKFIHLTYTGAGEIKRRVGIVGKGLTFDSGGYNIKAGAGSMIEMMKIDMGGSGAVLGAAKTLALLKPEGIEVHFVIAACENMVAGGGMRPGDILVASNGKTVEINNTDAEGRLTLADALLYVQNQGQLDAVVDIATLTGACMIALGPAIAGLYGSSDAAAEAVAAAARRAGEKVWRMPLEKAYADALKSPIADYKNVGGRAGGSIHAALFLNEFVDTERVAWVHLDAAAPVFSDKDGSATGFGAQTLAQWVLGEAGLAG
ncbi:hypothetical protein APUTEX25_002027 [Auxenochlorella protothecoides]|uniref:Cytosol aminopeptidase domain-containing protein n=2 Tax=Auxenochlorella protothecoides TaxID=3075 RepID=A0A3M7KV71_AUXPR|nr:hypothetical protein APUTEX25_002027 [Auxenochlorella protothecoides]|eukprot:RMZ54451.1 hypothetical protein APUTEX25_002027 [Auxenochlorella protothecoides]